MKKRIKIAFACYLVAIIIIAAFGVIYLFRSEFMPYHASAVGKPWAEVSPSFQVLILAMMKAIGGTCLTVVMLELILLLIPFRQGFAWARWAIPFGGILISTGSLYAMLFVGMNTSASPPYFAPVLALSVILIGMALSIKKPKVIEA
ncbi:MAG: hypothetical protein P8X55_20720 [Desulfosarcinaceae bacterium]